MATATTRLDQALVDRGLVETRSRAQALIMAGCVFVDDRKETKPGTKVKPGAALLVKGADHPWVSRGGLKLQGAIDQFGLDPTAAVAIDVGASTGGFTDVLLTRGAARVYAVDVGHGQLAWKLRQDERVVVLEKLNARYLTEKHVPEPVDWVVCDASFIGLRTVGVDLTGLAVLSGAIGVGLGFGLQKVVSNLVSGVIILLDKSIKPGDVISLGETFGWINSLGARYVSITTRDGREYLIPNEDLITGQVVNWSHSNDFVRLDIYFGTAYGDDPHKVRKIAVEAAKSVDRVLSVKPPVCHIVGFGDSSVDYILRFWIRDPTGGLTNIRGNVYLALWDAFQAGGISIPFPQREVRMLGEPAPIG